jgi:hypothetical protein
VARRFPFRRRQDQDGRAGHRSVWRRWYRPYPGRKANRPGDDDRVDTHFGVVRGVQAVGWRAESEITRSLP